MEDAHACLLDLNAHIDGGKANETDKRLAYFGVYDGHGGDKVAIYTGEHLHEIVTKQEAYKAGDLKKALQDGFLAADRAILSGRILLNCTRLLLAGLTHEQIPSTRKKCLAVPPQSPFSQKTRFTVSVLLSRFVYNCSFPQANAGDSRTVLGVKGRAKPLSFDHKPQNEGRSRPTNCGIL